MPTVVPWYFWGESLTISYFVCATFRYAMTLHLTWLVNSAAHLWGNKPYDKTINPSQNAFVTFGALGEGAHNYHHSFPMDYSTSEYGMRFNMTTLFIDVMAWIGQADQRKKMSPEAVNRKKERTGDGTQTFDQPRNSRKRVNPVDTGKVTGVEFVEQ
jgi:stearoyl-CoA desaturase (Delta-9 desaturase)